MTCEELLTLPLPKRIEWLRSTDGPRGKLSHDKLAAALGTSRQTVIGWEHGVEPKKLAHRLAEFSGCPEAVWLRGDGGIVVQETTPDHLRELRATVEQQGRDMTRALRALAGDVRALTRRLEAVVPRASEGGNGT